MARTALTAPAHTVAQRNPGSFGSASSVSPDLAPSLAYGGGGLQDPRLPYNKYNNVSGGTSSVAAQIVGWASDGLACTCDQVPSTIATANIAALANVTSGTAMTLVSTTGAGITVMATALTAIPSLNVIPSGTLAIDGTPGVTRIGVRDVTGFYDPTTGISRAVSITGVSSGAGGAFKVSGYDWYGYPQTQTVTVASGVNTVNSTKTFKFITSVVPQFTDAHNYSVGTADIFGFGMAADRFCYVDVYWVNVIQLVATFTAADATTPATLTTGDVRGTFTAGSASDGTKRLQIFIAPSSSRLCTTPINTVGLFGVTPV